MSQQNVAIVLKGIDAWNRHDAEEWLSYAAPEITWMPAGPAAVEQTVYRGHEEVASGFESVWETWEEFQCEEGEVRDLGESMVARCARAGAQTAHRHAYAPTREQPGRGASRPGIRRRAAAVGLDRRTQRTHRYPLGRESR